MKHLTLILFLSLLASPAMAQTVVCNGANVEDDPSTSTWTYKPMEPRDTTSCNGRPAAHKLLSRECPGCPLIWVYAVHDGNGPGVDYYELKEAADMWNRAMGSFVIGLVGYTPFNDIPTYGVTVRRHNGYTLYSSGTGGYWAGHTSNIDSVKTQRCYRDDIRLNPSPGMTRAVRVQTYAHELGHALLRGAGWHSTNSADLMYYRSNISGSNRRIDTKLKNYIQQYIIEPVLSGRMDLPCALRDLCD
jgi:hypothetical protein